MAAQEPGQSIADQPKSALYRKTQVGRVEHPTRAMSVPKALRLTMAKVADELFGMAMAAIGVRMEQRGGDALNDLFSENTLLMSLDGPSGRRAAAVFDASLVGGLIQQQTMGKVMPETGDETRPLTATDAAICAPFLDAMLERAALLLETDEERTLLQDYRFGIQAEDARVLEMTLDAHDYQIVHITVDIACGKRQGQLVLCLPLVSKAEEIAQQRGGDADDPKGGGQRRQKLLNGTVMSLNIDLNVALARISMPLSALGTLAPGDVLELGVTAFDQSRVLTMAGRGVGRGTLGQIDGLRALRLDHQKVVAATPKRRAGDRAELDLPNVTGDGTGTRTKGAELAAQDATFDRDAQRMPHGDTMEGLPALPDLPDMSEMPDMSDLPGLDEDEEYAELARAEAG